jgi:hypothetical protein
VLQVGRQLKDEQLQVVRELQCTREWEQRDPDHVALMCQETVQDGHSVLVFCASKAGCEAAAKHVARLVAVPERSLPGGGVTPGGEWCWIAPGALPRRCCGGIRDGLCAGAALTCRPSGVMEHRGASAQLR